MSSRCFLNDCLRHNFVSILTTAFDYRRGNIVTNIQTLDNSVDDDNMSLIAHRFTVYGARCFSVLQFTVYEGIELFAAMIES